MSASVARFGQLMAAPSPLDQAAAAINVALNDDDEAKGFAAAVDIFSRFNPLERFAVAMKAVALGADPRRVADANEASGSHVAMPAVDATPGGSGSPVVLRLVYSNCKHKFLCGATPVPVFTGAQAVDEVAYWVGAHKLAALGIALALAYGLWRVWKKGGK